MPATAAVPAWLAEYGPQLDLPELIEQTNKIYHSFEARYYDRRHPEVTGPWVERWQEMIGVALEESPRRSWRVLDFGCGTGFASLQLLTYLPAGSVASLTCYDLSPDMLECCREKLTGKVAALQFCNVLEEVSEHGPFDLLATNALLHHLPDPIATLQEVLPLLSPGALWLAGHEPSSRYYKNPECVRLWQEFRQAHRIPSTSKRLRSFTPGALWQKIHQFANRTPSPRRLTARAAFEQGLFRRLPPPAVIDRLVDYHVPRSTRDVEQGCGLDFEQLQAGFKKDWDLVWVKSCSFMGQTPYRKLSKKWLNACNQLAARYPLDGALFSTIWRRVDK